MKISNSVTKDANRGQSINAQFRKLNICQAFVKELWEVWSKAKDNIKVQESSQLKSLQTRFSSETRSRLSSHCRQDFHDKTLWEECTRYLLWASEDQ